MKTTDQLKPNYAPVYAAAMYPDLCKLFQKHGYALMCHGSLARDFDLLAMPWTETVSMPEEVMKEVVTTFAVRVIGNPTQRPHGREAYTLSVGFGECAIDLSFVPSITLVDSLKNSVDYWKQETDKAWEAYRRITDAKNELFAKLELKADMFDYICWVEKQREKKCFTFSTSNGDQISGSNYADCVRVAMEKEKQTQDEKSENS